MNLSELKNKVDEWKAEGKTVVFTNGCFDILHAGHIASLSEAASHGDKLVIGLNSDSSVKGLKGENRPVNNEDARAIVLSALAVVDAICIFYEETPFNLITTIKPDVMVKGGDYQIEDIAGAKEVIEWGGKVILNPIVKGFSTTSIIDKMKNSG